MTTTYEVEHDYSWGDLKPTQNTPTGISHLTISQAEEEDFLDNHKFLRSHNWTNQRIANHYNITLDALEKRLHRAGVTETTISPDRRRLTRIMDRLIASGEPFTKDQLPEGLDEDAGSVIVKAAVREGRIRAVGSVATPHGNRINVWQSVESVEVAA